MFGSLKDYLKSFQDGSLPNATTGNCALQRPSTTAATISKGNTTSSGIEIYREFMWM